MSKPMHVCFFVPWSGRDRLLLGLLDNVDPAVVRYEVVVLDDGKGDMAPALAERGVRLTGLDAMGTRGLVKAAVRLRAYLRTSQPDVVHANAFHAGLLTEVVRRTLRNPPASVLARHHNRNHHLQRKHVHVAVDRWAARQASVVLAVSAAVRRTLVEEEAVPGDRVLVVPNGLDESRVRSEADAVASWRQRFAGRELLVAVGRIDFQKDYSTLFQAVRRLAASRPDILLVAAGTGLPGSEAEARRLVHDLGIERHVELLGWVDDPFSLMAAADVFVQTSVDEAFGQTVLEAMLLGVPVVTTTAGSLAEVVGGEYPPLPTGDPDAVAAAVAAVLDDPEAARQRAAGIADRSRGRFTAARMADGVTAAYRRALGVD